MYIIITIPIVILLVWGTLDELDFKIDKGYFFDGYLAIAVILGIIFGYVVFTDLLRRILSYIDNWKIDGFIPYSRVWVKNIFIFIIWWIIFGGLIFLGSESKRNYCSGDFESVSYSNECACDFGYRKDKNICVEDIKEYKNYGLSFIYPSYLNVTEKPFEVFQFFNSDNMHVKKYSLQTLVTSCVDSLAERRSDGDKSKQEQLKKELFAEYRKKILKIQEWGDIYPMDYFDYISCGATEWPINFLETKSKDGTNWIVINYYFTQDDKMGCLTQVNTELLLVKNENEIYSIIFRNNFGDFRSYMEWFRTKYSWKLSEEACMMNNDWKEWLYAVSAEKSADDLPNYFSRGVSLRGNGYDWIEYNDKIIQKIISTVKID